MKRTVLWVFAVGAFAPAAWSSPTPWSVIDDADGLVVYERPVENASIIEFRGVGTLPAPIEKVLTILTDETRAPEWADGLAKAYRLQQISPMEWIEYNHFNTPFVIKDRDIVNRVKVEMDRLGRKARVIQQSVTHSLAPSTSYVRADLQHAEFRLEARGQDTLFDGEIRIDPKGSMPKWIFNLFQRSWPRTTFESVKRQAARADVVVNPLFRDLALLPNDDVGPGRSTKSNR